jgi:hypothetical protein
MVLSRGAIFMTRKTCKSRNMKTALFRVKGTKDSSTVTERTGSEKQTTIITTTEVWKLRKVSPITVVNIRIMSPQDKSDSLVLGQEFILSFLQGIDKTLPRYPEEKHVLFICVKVKLDLNYQYDETNMMHFSFTVIENQRASTCFEHYLLILRRHYTI